MQQKYGLHCFFFPDTTTSYFAQNEEVALFPAVYRAAVQRLGFHPTFDLFAEMHNSQHDRFLSARPCKLTSGVNAFNYRWTEEAGFANPHGP